MKEKQTGCFVQIEDIFLSIYFDQELSVNELCFGPSTVMT